MYKTIRKNEKKQIRAKLEACKGILIFTSEMRLDDAYDSTTRIVSVEQVMEWLEDESNYRSASAYENEYRVHVGGHYHFCTYFEGYKTDEEWQQALGRRDLAA